MLCPSGEPGKTCQPNRRARPPAPSPFGFACSAATPRARMHGCRCVPRYAAVRTCSEQRACERPGPGCMAVGAFLATLRYAPVPSSELASDQGLDACPSSNPQDCDQGPRSLTRRVWCADILKFDLSYGIHHYIIVESMVAYTW